MAVAKKKTRRVVSGAPKVSLPKERSESSTELEDFTYLIFGTPKVGKTSLVSHFPATLCCMFEPGAKALEIYEAPIPSWDYFVAYVDLLVDGDHEFRNCAIDTGQVANDMCLEYESKQMGIEHPGGQNDYGKSWNRIKTAFQREHNRIMSVGLGLIVTAHADVEEVESLSGDTFNRIVPALGSQAAAYYKAVVDNLFYYHFIGNDRFLSVRGNDMIFAGTRCEQNYLTPSGEQIYKVPMGKSSAEAYENLTKAFRNEQTDTFENLKTKEEIAKDEAEEKSRKADRLRKKKKPVPRKCK